MGIWKNEEQANRVAGGGGFCFLFFRHSYDAFWENLQDPLAVKKKWGLGKRSRGSRVWMAAATEGRTVSLTDSMVIIQGNMKECNTAGKR